MKRLSDWLVDQLGARSFINSQLYHKVPRNVSPLDFLGVASAFMFVNQVITGILLATWYNASANQAYQSVQRIMHQVPAGWVIRDLHYWGANAMVVLVFLHMLRVFYIGAYRKPRELTWLAGVGLLLITILFAFTGYLLPWDQQSYWATMVGTWMPSYTPVIGYLIVLLARGGAYITGVTLTRFYAVHVLVLPALFLIVFGLHFYLVLTKQLTMVTELERAPESERKKAVTFFPTTVFQMMMFLVIVGSLLLLLAVDLKAPLLAIADPLNRAHYNPVPLWFFYSIYELLKFIPAALDPLGIIGLPLVAGIVLFALPFVDKKPHRRPAERKGFLVPAAAAVAGIVVLTYMGSQGQGLPTKSTVASNPTYQTDVLPILQQYCAQCHSQSASQSLGTPYLLSYSSVFAPYKGHAILVKGNAQQSILYQRITSTNPGLRMPLGGAPIPSWAVKTIATWINQGAKP